MNFTIVEIMLCFTIGLRLNTCDFYLSYKFAGEYDNEVIHISYNGKKYTISMSKNAFVGDGC